MAVKTIALTREAYDDLVAVKRKGESFSELVLRLTGSPALLSPYAGAWSTAPGHEVAKVRRFLRATDVVSRADLKELSRRRIKAGRKLLRD